MIVYKLEAKGIQPTAPPQSVARCHSLAAGSSGSGSNPGLDAPLYGSLAQSVEQGAVNHHVPGSIPGGSVGFLFSYIIFLLEKGSCIVRGSFLVINILWIEWG